MPRKKQPEVKEQVGVSDRVGVEPSKPEPGTGPETGLKVSKAEEIQPVDGQGHISPLPGAEAPASLTTEPRATATTGPPVAGPTVPEKAALDRKEMILDYIRDAQKTFLFVGELLYRARENADWTVLHYETFKEYIEDLKLPMENSYSWATRLVGIYEYLIASEVLSADEALEIGVAKLSRLLPAARDGKLTPEIIELAKNFSDLELRAALGHTVGDQGPLGDEPFIHCPRCGIEIRHPVIRNLVEKLVKAKLAVKESPPGGAG